MTSKTQIWAIMAGLVITLATLLLAAPQIVAQTSEAQDSTTVAGLFKDARSSAVQLRKDAALMESYGRSKMSWESHAAQITIIKEHVNKLGRLLQQMNDARDGASAWQKDAIDHITPLLKEVAANTTTTINHLNDNKGAFAHHGYKELLSANYQLTKDFATLVGDYVDYGEAKETFATLESKVGTVNQ
jgi:hypothetical protein